MNTIAAVAASAVYSEVRMPYSNWVNTSRPRVGSIPNQYSDVMPPLGPAGMLKSFRSVGSSCP